MSSHIVSASAITDSITESPVAKIDQEINTEVDQDNENLEDPNARAEDLVPEAAESPSELTFGELARANIPEVIDVASTFGNVGSLVKNDPIASIQPPPGASLGSVLSQALRTNDTALLETCFHTSEISTIRATIQRLESNLAAKLLQKLAERLHKRPGIAGKLMVWVQWTLIAHGGYLAAQRGLVKSLSDLTKVMDERSQGLKSVLLLKGKLDMIEAQIEMRRNIHSSRRRMDVEEDDDESIIYVEGQENDDIGAKEFLKESVDEIMNDELSEESYSSDEMLTVNGTMTDSEDEDQSSSDEDSLIDDEARDSNSDILPFYNT